MTALARVLPRPVSYLIGETAGAAFFLLSRRRRSRIAANLRIVLGDVSRLRAWLLGLRIMLSFGRSVVETLMIPHLSAGGLLSMVTIEGEAKLDRIRMSGTGVVLVTGHLGSWELGGVALAARGYRITTVAGVRFTAGMSPALKAVSERAGIQIATSHGGSTKLLKALKRREIVALHLDGDQYMGGIETRFFGRTALLPRGPAALSLMTGAPCVPAFAIRRARGRITVEIGDPVSYDGRDEAGLIARIASEVEARIKDHVDQWCLFRDLWRPQA